MESQTSFVHVECQRSTLTPAKIPPSIHTLGRPPETKIKQTQTVLSPQLSVTLLREDHNLSFPARTPPTRLIPTLRSPALACIPSGGIRILVTGRLGSSGEAAGGHVFAALGLGVFGC